MEEREKSYCVYSLVSYSALNLFRELSSTISSEIGLAQAWLMYAVDHPNVRTSYTLQTKPHYIGVAVWIAYWVLYPDSICACPI
jgi:hypothetical protein